MQLNLSDCDGENPYWEWKQKTRKQSVPEGTSSQYINSGSDAGYHTKGLQLGYYPLINSGPDSLGQLKSCGFHVTDLRLVNAELALLKLGSFKLFKTPTEMHTFSATFHFSE